MCSPTMTLSIAEQLRMRALGAARDEDKALDLKAAELIDTLEACRAADQQFISALQHKLDAFVREVMLGTMPPVIRQLVDMIMRATPSMTEADAIEIVEKAAAKVFNEEFKQWPRSKPQDH